MDRNDKVGFVYVLLLLVTTVGLINHVIMIPTLYEEAGRDSWLSVIFTFFLVLPWLLLIPLIANRTKQKHLMKWMLNHLPKALVYPLLFFIVIFIFLTAAVTTNDLVIWTNITYLPNTPKFAIIVLFVGVCVYLASTSIRTIVIVNTILLPVVILLGIFVATTNMESKDYSLLFPVLVDGVQPVLKGMIYTTACILEVFMVLFLQHKVKDRIHYKGMVLVTLFLIMLGLGPVMGGIAAFGADTVIKERFPAYIQWQLVSIGRFIEHLDFFSIYQWLSGALIRISLSLYVLSEILQINNKKNKRRFLQVVGILIVIITILPINDRLFVSFIKYIYLPYNLIFITLLSFILFIAVMLKGKGKKLK
ncbi:GerAB/ArcD/ProY family transporter [Piscibacillus sp. B03]|uniref:GerAB/ArcD/ProY family transporter n=1 Tax=Piscibacillus sp. B03 TaxID=3457430 RepID=UPI003FCC3117